MGSKILITGGLGYIGSFTAKNFLKKTKTKAISIDNLSRGNKFSQKFSKNIRSNISNNKIKKIILNKKLNTVFHLASLTCVRESLKKKKNYFESYKSQIKFIKNLKNTNIKYFIFSSSLSIFEKNRYKSNLSPYSKYKLIVIPSYRTPENILKLAFNYFNDNHLVIKERDKKAYLSSLGLADIIIVTCDSTSMISEAAITGKPVYIAQMKHKKSIHRFEKFYKLFKDLGIIRDLEDKIEYWKYEGLDEVNRAANLVKEQMKKNGII